MAKKKNSKKKASKGLGRKTPERRYYKVSFPISEGLSRVVIVRSTSAARAQRKVGKRLGIPPGVLVTSQELRNTRGIVYHTTESTQQGQSATGS